MKRLLLSLALIGMMVPSAAPADEGCASCHGNKNKRGYVDQKVLEGSVHASLACVKCHLNIAPHPHGEVARVKCGICHLLGREGAPSETAREFRLSVHGKALAAGNSAAPTCQACHGAHDIYPARDARSPTRKENIPVLCATCHPKEAEEYGGSVHAKKLAGRDNANTPTCFDCHQEHLAPRTSDERWRMALVRQCGNCHPGQMETYQKTYHGKVTQLGYATMAQCSDCHGAHGIRPVADSASPLSERNILTTCRKCHPRATAGFTKFYAHPDEGNREKYPIIYFTQFFMTALLIGVFAFFLTHTFLWAYRALKERVGKKNGA